MRNRLVKMSLYFSPPANFRNHCELAERAYFFGAKTQATEKKNFAEDPPVDFLHKPDGCAQEPYQRRNQKAALPSCKKKRASFC